MIDAGGGYSAAIETSVPGLYTTPSALGVPVPVNQGGTGQTTAAAALSALGGVGLPAAPTFIGFSFDARNAAAVLSSTLSAGTVQEGDLIVLVVDSTNFTSVPDGFQMVGGNAGALSGAGAVPNFMQANNVNSTTQKMFAFYAWMNSVVPASWSVGASLSSGILACFRGAYGAPRGLTVRNAVTTDGSGNGVMPALVSPSANGIQLLAVGNFDNPVDSTGNSWTLIKSIAGVGGTNFPISLWQKAISNPGVIAGGSFSGGGATSNYGALCFEICPT